MNAQNSATSGSKLVIIGSGFHRQVLGGISHPLCDWVLLLQSVAERVGGRLTAEDCVEPTQAWEKLAAQVAAKTKKGLQANRAEKVLKMELCQILQKNIDGTNLVYCHHSLSEMVASFLRRGGNHLVSLNFDQLAYWEQSNRAWRLPQENAYSEDNTGSRKADHQLLYRRTRVPNQGAPVSMIWHPHGCIKSPQTLRLGYRDYGMLPAAYDYAFKQFKRWERRVVEKSSRGARRAPEETYSCVLEALAELDREPRNPVDIAADTWVTRFMLLPVEVIGAEISPHELGLRWLFVQRHRNLQQYAPDSLPVIHRKAASCQLPWKSRTQEYSSWNEAWSAALARRSSQRG